MHYNIKQNTDIQHLHQKGGVSRVIAAHAASPFLYRGNVTVQGFTRMTAE